MDVILRIYPKDKESSQSRREWNTLRIEVEALPRANENIIFDGDMYQVINVWWESWGGGLVPFLHVSYLGKDEDAE